MRGSLFFGWVDLFRKVQSHQVPLFSIGDCLCYRHRLLGRLVSRALTSRSDPASALPSDSVNHHRVELEVLDKKDKLTTRKIQTLADILQVDHSEARRIVQSCRRLLKVEPGILVENYAYLKDLNVRQSRILRNPSLLLIQNGGDISKQLGDVMNLLGLQSMDAALPLTIFTRKKLSDVARMWRIEAKVEPALVQGGFSNRIEYLAHFLETDPEEITDMMTKAKGLPTLPFSKLHLILQTLLDGGIDPVFILSDPWIFNHNVDTIKERLQELSEKKFKEVKPWLLRCSRDKFEGHVARNLAEKELKGNPPTVQRFLQKKLNLTPSFAEGILRRVPLDECKAYTMNKMISFLLSQGFTTQDIATTPRILQHSVVTVEQKLKELSAITNDKKLPVTSLSILCQSLKKYEKFKASLMTRNERLRLKRVKL